MEFREYQIEARKTAIYPNKGTNFIYPTLGLCGETGEIAEKIKKIIRDDGGLITFETKTSLIKELGDVLWYIANLCEELEVDMNFVAKYNIEKLRDRQNRNKLHGSGDER